MGNFFTGVTKGLASKAVPTGGTPARRLVLVLIQDIELKHIEPISGLDSRPAAIDRIASPISGLPNSAILVAVDTLIVGGFGCFFGAINGSLFSLSTSLAVIIWLAVLYFKGFYRLRQDYPSYQRSYELFKAFAISMLLTSAVFYLFPAVSVPRSVAWSSGLLSLVGLMGWRALYERLVPVQVAVRRLLIVGAGQSGRHIAQEIMARPAHAYQVVGFVDDDAQKLAAEFEGCRVIGTSLELPMLVQRHSIDSIVLAITHDIQETTLKAIGDCIELGVMVRNVPQLYEHLSGRIPIEHISHYWFVQELDESNRQIYVLAKRMIDIAFSFVGLLVTALITPVIALLIYIDSPGSLFYSQVRTGKNNRTFRIYKFRTMVENAEKGGAVWARVSDSRITRVGHFLRRTRLDELPQLYNVIRGDMSLVGPRPERPEFVEDLARHIPFFHRRHMVLPGLTGWAQINFPYGASVDDSKEKLKYDLYYIKNRSVFMDLLIMLRTVGVMINKTGSR